MWGLLPCTACLVLLPQPLTQRPVPRPLLLPLPLLCPLSLPLPFLPESCHVGEEGLHSAGYLEVDFLCQGS